MKIETGWEKQQLNNIPAGTLIYYDEYCIVTDTVPSDDKLSIYCVCVETGELIAIPLSYVVKVIDKAVLKIGG